MISSSSDSFSDVLLMLHEAVFGVGERDPLKLEFFSLLSADRVKSSSVSTVSSCIAEFSSSQLSGISHLAHKLIFSAHDLQTL